MMSLKQKYGPLALVAGASEGIGAAYSSYLAAEGPRIERGIPDSRDCLTAREAGV